VRFPSLASLALMTNSLSGGVPTSFGDGWIKNHAAACKAAGKPCLLEECKPKPISHILSPYHKY